jgi:hypothetical protein
VTHLCRKPDDAGTFNPRCEHIIRRPRDSDQPRQCLRAAKRGTAFCDAHQSTSERIIEAETMGSRLLADANEAAERGAKKTADKLYARGQHWLDKANALRGWN